MLITTKVVSSNPVHGEVYSIQHYVTTFPISKYDYEEYIEQCAGGRHCGRDRKVVGFTTICAIGAYHH